MSLPDPRRLRSDRLGDHLTLTHNKGTQQQAGRISDNGGSMVSVSFVAIFLSFVLGIANGFVVSSPSSLNVRQNVGGGAMSMLFGGGAKKAAKGGIVVKVQQKTGFKETEVTLAGKTNLRKALLDNKIDVYPLQVSDSWIGTNVVFAKCCVRVRKAMHMQRHTTVFHVSFMICTRVNISCVSYVPEEESVYYCTVLL